MIAHRVKRTSGKGGYAKLGCYILDVKTPADPALFERLASYITDCKDGPERVVAAHVANCGSLELADAMKEIGATQDRNRRSSADKSYHLVISFPAGERPTLGQLRDIEEHLVASIGLGDHQRISAIHDDTDNLHVHVAINKVHPTTFHNIEPYYDHPKLMAACRELELRHGLILDNHGLSVDQERGLDDGIARSQIKARDGAVKMEAHRGQESLTRWIAENAKADLAKAAVDAPTWPDLHAAFAKHGLEVRQKGAGLAAGVPGTSAWVKASSIDRALSINALTGRLGPFVGAEQRAVRQVQTPSKAYVHTPMRGGVMTENLYDRYKRTRATAEEARSAAVTGVNQAYVSYSQQLREYYRNEKTAIRARGDLRGWPRKTALERVEAARKEAFSNRHSLAAMARMEARAVNPLPTWQKFLEAEASRGVEAALSVLRARVVTSGGQGVGSLMATDVSGAGHVVYQHLSPEVRHNGDVVYVVKDGGRVTDRSAEVRADRMSPGAAFLALSLAVDRFGSRPLAVDGSEAFKAALIEVAVSRGMDVRFSDPAMEDAKCRAVARSSLARVLTPGPEVPREVSARQRGAECALSR